MDFKPYISLDVETTGLEPGSQILQVAMIFDDWKTPVEQLPAVSFLVDNQDELFQGRLEPTALAMNAWIFDAISNEKSKYPIYDTQKARNKFREFLNDCYQKLGGKSITFAGKNIAGFDLKHLAINGFFDGLPGHMVSHRHIDIGSLYLADFGYVPTQREINEITGRKEVTHDALDDATDVICAIRRKFKVGV